MQKNQFLFIISLIFSGIIAFFALINGNTVTVDLFFYKIDASLALVILSSTIIGAIIVSLLGIAQYIKMKIELRKLAKDNQEVVRKNEELIKMVKDSIENGTTKKTENAKNVQDIDNSKAVSEANIARGRDPVE
jgi:uncharacterized integral membrane protein